MRVAIVYNELQPSRYTTAGEEKAVRGVLNAVAAVHRALIELGYDVTCIPLSPPLEQARKILGSPDADIVFNLFEGFCGYPETEAMVPEVLSAAGIPCTGCPGTILGLALDKAKVKVMLQAAGIPTPDFQLLNPRTTHLFQLGYPCIIKPRREDASHGITEASIVNNFAELEEQLPKVTESYGGALVEEFLEGREFNATVLGNSQHIVLPVSEIVYSLAPDMPRILTFAAKWEPDSPYYMGTKAVCPAETNTQEQERLTRTAQAAFRLLGCRGYARVDMRMDGEGRLNVIEVNPNPDISPDAGAARQAEAAGMTYTQFIDRILQQGLEKEYHGDKDTLHAKKRQTGLNANTVQHARI